MQKSILDKMPQFIQFFIVKPLCSAVSLWRNYGFHALFSCLLNDCIAVITAIRQQIIRIKPFNQATSLRTIRCGTLRNKNSDRHTMRIHGQMYLAVEPPFVRLMS